MKYLYLAIVLIGVRTITFGQAAGDFQTHQTGAWSNPATWEQFDGVVWVTPAPFTPTDADGIITILSPHVVTITTDVSIDDATINTGATVILNSGINLDFPGFTFADVLTINGTVNNSGSFNAGILSNIQVNGTFINNQGATFNNTDPGWVFFNSGSTYDHRYTITKGDLPLVAWDDASTCLISGYTTNAWAPNNLNQEFGNFTWNTPLFSGAAPAYINLAGQLTTVDGNLRIVATGTTGAKQLQLAHDTIGFNSGFTLEIGGDLKLEGGTVQFVTNMASPSTINLHGNWTQTATNVVMTQTLGDITVNIAKSFSKTAGSISRIAAGAATLNFNGGGVTQTYGFAGTVISSAVNFTVEAGSVLSLGTSSLSGTGALTNNGTIILGSTDASGAIQTGAGNAGNNIRVTGTRTYAAGSTLSYTAAGAQHTGNGYPTASDINLTINNAAGVTMDVNVTISAAVQPRTLTLTAGALVIGAHTLTIDGVISGAGSLTGGLTSNISIGGTGSFGSLSVTGGIINNFTLNRSSTGLVALGSDLTIKGTFTQTVGDLDLNGKVLTISGPFARTGGSLDVGATSSLIVNGTGALPAAVTFQGPGGVGSGSLDTLNVNRSSTTFPTNSTLTIKNLKLLAGTFNNTGTVTMATGGIITRTEGSIINNTPQAVTTYDVVYNVATDISTGSEIPSLASQLRNVTKTGSAKVTLSQDVTINGILTLSNGSLDIGAHAMDLKGNFVANAASILTAGSCTFSGTTSISGGSLVKFGNVTITGSLTPTINIEFDGNLVNSGTLNSGSGTTTFGGTTTVSGSSTCSFNNVTVSNTLTAKAGTMNIGGNLVNNGTFNHNNGTIGFNGTTTISGSATTNLFTVNITGTLTAPAANLGIAGSLANTGTFNNNSGTVLFNGTVAAQSITGSSTTFNNMTVSNPVSPGLGINTTVRLNGTLTLGAGGFFDADGTGSGVFIVSSSSQIAGGLIATLPTPANFTGNVTVERYVHGQAGGDYRYLAMPITTGNVSMLKSSIFVTGNYSDRSTHADNANINDANNTKSSIQTYNPTTQAYVDLNGGGGLTAATSLANNIGYAAYDFNDGAVTGSYRGTIGKGNVVVAISSTLNNFDLVPNPYPSPIDWDNVVKTNVNNAMYVRISAPNVYSSYVGGVVTNAPFVGWTGEVATGQSFFVTSSGTGSTLTFREADKTSNSYYFLRTVAPDNYMRIALESGTGDRDEAVVRFLPEGTDGVDPDYDAIKLRNDNIADPGFTLSHIQNPNLSSYLETPANDYSINSLGLVKGVKVVRLKVSDVKEGQYSLSFSDLSTMNLGYNIVLVDTYLNEEVEVKDNDSYEFAVNSDAKSAGDSRFYLRINGSAVVTAISESVNDLKVYPNPTVDKLQIYLAPEQESSLSHIGLYDVLGHTMTSSDADQSLLEPGTKTIDMSNYTGGVYILTVRYGDKIKSTRVIKK